MKKLLLAATLVSLCAFAVYETELSKKDREFAIQYMQQSLDSLLLDVKGLTPQQLNWKLDTTRWSVAECVEHIALSEGQLTAVVMKNLDGPADPSRRDSVKFTDQQIIGFITNRTQKFKAAETLKPNNTFGSYQAALDSFVARRTRNIEFIKTTKADMRDHYWTPQGFGTVDDYQALLFMVAHSVRHTKQLEEVKATQGFPK